MSAAGTHEYKEGFYEYINAGSLASADVVCPIVLGWLPVASLLDVGCGAGAWCRIWSKHGVSEVLGTDGDYVDRASLLVPAESFVSHDLSKSFDQQRKFDLVTSLEVAEHIPEAQAATFVDNLTRHGDVVLFSAAVPGQSGEFHVNEQPLEYWRTAFAARGYRCFDALRPRVENDKRVEPWYRYNTLLYVRAERVAGLPASVLETEVTAGQEILERASPGWRARNAILLRMPQFVLDVLVKLKHEWGRRTRPGNV